MPVYKDNAANRKLDRVGKTYGYKATGGVAPKAKAAKHPPGEPYLDSKGRLTINRAPKAKKAKYILPKSWNKFYQSADNDDLHHIIDEFLGGAEDAEKSPKLTKQHKSARNAFKDFLKTEKGKTSKSDAELARRFRQWMSP